MKGDPNLSTDVDLGAIGRSERRAPAEGVPEQLQLMIAPDLQARFASMQGGEAHSRVDLHHLFVDREVEHLPDQGLNAVGLCADALGRHVAQQRLDGCALDRRDREAGEDRLDVTLAEALLIGQGADPLDLPLRLPLPGGARQPVGIEQIAECRQGVLSRGLPRFLPLAKGVPASVDEVSQPPRFQPRRLEAHDRIVPQLVTRISPVQTPVAKKPRPAALVRAPYCQAGAASV